MSNKYTGTTNTKSEPATPAGSKGTQGTMDAAKQKAQEQAEAHIASQKDRAAGSLEGVADALKKTGKNLREQDQEAIPEAVEAAAEQVEEISDYIRNTDARELVTQVERFGRTQPLIFLGASFVAGIFLARFLKSSGRGRRRQR